jgi:hypothetical protein
MEYSGAGGKLIHEKNQKQKISWHCPFKDVTKLDQEYFSPEKTQTEFKKSFLSLLFVLYHAWT